MAQIPCVVDTCSVDLEINAENKLQADVILDPDGALICTPGEGVGINIGVGGCGVELFINGSNELIPNVNIDINRGLGCDGTGLFVRRSPNPCNSLFFDGGQLRVNEHDSGLFTAGTSTPLALPGVVQTFLGIQVDLDAWFAAFGNLAVELSQRAVISVTNNSCRTMNFEHAYGIIPRYLAGNGWNVYMGCRQEIVSPNVTGVTAPFTEFNHFLNPFNPGTGHGLTFPPQRYFGTSFLLPGQNATIQSSCILQVATNGAGTIFGNIVEFRFGAAAQLYLWTDAA